MIKIAIADDHPLMLEGVKNVLSREMEAHVTGEANNCNQVFEMLNAELPDILILDFTMPGKSGLDMLKDIKNLYPELPILILSIHPPERFAVRCIKSGADGYLCKSVISDELNKAVRQIIKENRKYISPEVGELLALKACSKDDCLHELLSDREFEILCMIAGGMSVQKIAKKLSLSTNTIHTYRYRIKDKLEVSSNVDMAKYAFQHGLIN
ncbi:DNA-binding response regulator [Rhodohalobacter sp. SW132]|uniref:response regulator n=1 Tax=Rhodohalobacter sp. SW132 TaxID=2293433 RepID=UPI000E226AEB|nr:response regulator transcription factor [Rhodohalobacter sp. SW132]REL32935.1 DNA-binding response regulator [Rhodohalobacter sp. SW132]